MHRNVGAGGDGKSQADKKCNVVSAQCDRERDRQRADGDRGRASDEELFGFVALAVAHEIKPDVVCERRRRGDRQAGDDRENRCKGDGGDEGGEQRPAEIPCQQAARRDCCWSTGTM